PAAALAPPSDYAVDCHRAGALHGSALRRARDGGAPDPEPGRAEPAAAVRGLPTGDVCRQPQEDGGAGRPALDARTRVADRGPDRGTQCVDALANAGSLLS